MPTKIDITGQTYGRLTAIRSEKRTGSTTPWIFRCECGNITRVSLANVRNGHTKSCGCLAIETTVNRSRVHGEGSRKQKSPEYKAWKGMKTRCHDPRDKSFERYGAKGVTVCGRWRNSFAHFLADMGRKPSPCHSIDRIENSLGYQPGNCRWATDVEQANNHANNRKITFNGKTMNLGQWAKAIGIKPNTLGARIRAGWSLDQAMTKHDYRT